MIKINLIGDQGVNEGSEYTIVYAYVASLLLCAVGAFLLYTSASSEISELTTRKEDLQIKLAKLERTTREVRDLESKKAELDDKLSVIAKLKLSKRGPVRVLDDLNMALPPTMWITEIKEVNNVLSLRGLALDNTAVVDLMKALESSEFFKSVDLDETTQVYLVRGTEEVNPDHAYQLDQSHSNQRRGQGRTSVSDQARQNYRTRDTVHRLVTYDRLSKAQRDAFDRDLFGYGMKVRSFSIRAALSYSGKIEVQTETPKAATPAASKKKRSSK